MTPTPPSTPAAPVAATPTPRTDAAQYDSQPGHPLVSSVCFVVPADFARQLERDLAARDAELATLRERVVKQNWKLSAANEEECDLRAQLQTATERAERAEQERDAAVKEHNVVCGIVESHEIELAALRGVADGLAEEAQILVNIIKTNTVDGVCVLRFDMTIGTCKSLAAYRAAKEDGK